MARTNVKVESPDLAKPGLRLLPIPALGALVRGRRNGALLAPLPEHRVRKSLPDRLSGSLGILLSFILLVVVPTAVAGYYYAFLASSVFVSESKFAVRGNVEKLPSSGAGAGAIGMLSSLTSMNSNQDAFMVADFIHSKSLVEQLDRNGALRSLYAQDSVDPVARLKRDVSVEELRDYWRDMTSVTIDNMSGIVTLQAKAYSAKDALDVSSAVLRASEALVNEISERKRNDTVRYASDEVGRSEQRLQAARLALQEFRNKSGVLDPVKAAEATVKLIGGLKVEKIQIETQLATVRRTLSEQAPSVQVLNATLKAVSDQIVGLERLMTATSGSNGEGTTSRTLFQYEGLELERQFSEKVYLIAQAALERARATAQRQQLYFVTFVKPALAEEATFPHRLKNTFLIFACAGAIWSVLVLLGLTVKDHAT